MEAVNTSIYSPAASAPSSATGTLSAIQNIVANLLNTAASMYRVSQGQATPITQTQTVPSGGAGLTATLASNAALIVAAAAVFVVVLLLVRK